MIRRIVLENFMSHAHTVLELADGLTILVGPNNCGKSAVVSALQTLCANLTGDYMVRHGEREARVTVETDDGHSISWRRRGHSVSYVIDGVEHNRLRGGTPERLHEILRLPRVRSQEHGDDEFDIHFGTQKAPIFLLNEPERRAATFFAASSDAALLLQMQKRHSDKVKDRRRERDALNESVVRLDAELAALAPVADLDKRLLQAEQEFELLGHQREHLNRHATVIEAVQRELQVGAQLDAEQAALTALRQPPQPVDVEPYQSAIDRFESTAHRLVSHQLFTERMAGLRTPPELNEVGAIETLCRNLAAESNEWESAEAAGTALATLTAAPETHDVQALQQLVADLSRIEHESEQIARHYIRLEPLRAHPALTDTHALQSLVDALVRESSAGQEAQFAARLLSNLSAPADLTRTDTLRDLIAQTDLVNERIIEDARAIEWVEAERNVTAQEIRRWVQRNPICGTCGSPIDADRLMQEGHDHEPG